MRCNVLYKNKIDIQKIETGLISIVSKYKMQMKRNPLNLLGSCKKNANKLYLKKGKRGSHEPNTIYRNKK